MFRLPCLALLGLAACTGRLGEPAASQVPAPEPENEQEVVACGPGRVTLLRLNRSGYDNAVHELLGDETRPAREFPPDDFGSGFDGIASVLTISPLHLEKWEASARDLIERNVRHAGLEPVSLLLEAEGRGVTSTTGGPHGDLGWNLYSNGSLSAEVTLPAQGRYVVSVRAFGQQAGPDPARMSILLDERALATVDVTATADAPAVYRAEVETGPGAHAIGARFENDFYDPVLGLDRNLVVDWVQIEGPAGAFSGEPPAGRALVYVCDPTTGPPCVRTIVESFARRAWPACDPGGRPERDDDFRTRVDQMIDLMVVALQCDRTRVITFMLGNAGSGRVHDFLGIRRGHHEISHHQNDAANHADLQAIGTWEVGRLAALAGKLKAATDGEAPLLDSTMVLFSSEIADGDAHGHADLPVLLVGKGGGAVRPGRHVRHPRGTAIAGLYLSIAQAMGVNTTSFGDDGRTPLAELA